MSFIYNIPRAVTPPAAMQRSIKMNNIHAYLGDDTIENARLQFAVDRGATWVQFYGLYAVFGDGMDTELAAFISKARNVYGIQKVGCIMGNQSGFNSALTYNSGVAADEQFDDFNFENEFWFGLRVVFTVENAVVGNTYTLTIDGTDHSYVCQPGDDESDIANEIYQQIVETTFDKTLNGPDIEIWADSPWVPYTYSFTSNIGDAIINDTKANWLDTMDWLKAQMTGTKETSAYVQNYSTDPRWDVSDAGNMIQSIDVYESTNYTLAPDADRSIESQLYLLADALAADPGVKPKQRFVQIFSAEVDYMGPYLQGLGGGIASLNTAEADWDSQYAAYSDPLYDNRNYMDHIGTSYFDINRLIIYT